MKGKRAATIGDYLEALGSEQRTALVRLRKAIQAAAPGAEECISYGLPAFRFEGRVLVGFGASADHCSFYPMSGSTVKAHASALRGYETSKGTIRFQPEKPLPLALVRRLVASRIAENRAR